jgi:hypothetical protein
MAVAIYCLLAVEVPFIQQYLSDESKFLTAEIKGLNLKTDTGQDPKSPSSTYRPKNTFL